MCSEFEKTVFILGEIELEDEFFGFKPQDSKMEKAKKIGCKEISQKFREIIKDEKVNEQGRKL